MGFAAESERDRLRRADLNKEIARAAMGGNLWDYLGLLSPAASDAPGEGTLTWLARRLGLLGS